MKTDAGKTESIWTTTADIPPRPILDADDHANVCIVGAGIAGLTTAYMLAREGKSVIVLDDGLIAGGETGRTTAHLSNALDDRYVELERLFGDRGARLAAESHTTAIDQIEAIVEDEGIECEFQRLDGYLFLPPGSDVGFLDDELEAARRAGLAEVERVDRAPVDNFNTGAALRFPRQAQFHPVKYMAGLAAAVEKYGGRIFTQSRVVETQNGEHPWVKTAAGHVVKANFVVYATNTPINDWVKIHTKQAPYRTYVVGGLIPRGCFPKILLWDNADPYHYIRTQELSEEHDVLLIGGADHKTGQAHDTDSRFDYLEEFGRRLCPRIEFAEFRWSGQVLEPVDALAFIGRNPGDDNVFIATGDSGHGMTHGTIAGILITDLIQGRDNEWARLYDPSRKSLRAVGEYVSENLNVAAQYLHFVTGGDVPDASQIPRGSGAVVRRGFEKIAVYKAEDGTTTEFSAICSHAGCVVEWNGTEKTWDCPCHGSRFSVEGKVINGPAIADLSPAEQDEPPVTPAPVAQ
jgi:glycine/D-amino acid oxidase-like deaminating enzyme/nitrite reductase/ring-hydroxylating ferredoxin subunit